MRNIDVINDFIDGGSKAKTRSLKIVRDSDGTKLFNYDTCIAERNEFNGEFRGFKVNMTKYSQSTTRIQNKLVELLPKPIKIAVGVPLGAKDLYTVFGRYVK